MSTYSYINLYIPMYLIDRDLIDINGSYGRE